MVSLSSMYSSIPDRRLVVPQLAQGHRHGAVDDLEHSSAGELFVFYQRNVRLDPGGVAIHHERDHSVGASTVTWLLRKPCLRPSSRHSARSVRHVARALLGAEASIA